jgi:hypothetical protein
MGVYGPVSSFTPKALGPKMFLEPAKCWSSISSTKAHVPSVALRCGRVPVQKKGTASLTIGFNLAVRFTCVRFQNRWAGTMQVRQQRLGRNKVATIAHRAPAALGRRHLIRE